MPGLARAEPWRNDHSHYSGEHRGEHWYSCARQARPFSEVKQIPPELRVPVWFVGLLGISAVTGILLGFNSQNGVLPHRIANAAFSASLYTYITVSAYDLWEHFRLEKYVTGRYVSWVVVPFAETIVHGAIASTLTAFIYFARPLSPVFGWQDWALIAAPFVFLGLGWVDELVFHRRRSLHREDMLHTVSHLAAGTMMAALVASRMIDWSRIQA